MLCEMKLSEFIIVIFVVLSKESTMSITIHYCLKKVKKV